MLAPVVLHTVTVVQVLIIAVEVLHYIQATVLVTAVFEVALVVAVAHVMDSMYHMLFSHIILKLLPMIY